jgi:hypothetical protein
MTVPQFGCKNPTAVNYNPLALQDDYSCIYLFENQGTCYMFTDEQPGNLIDNSFTLSYSILGGCWVFFHDYAPDMYVHTRNNLYALFNADATLYKMNTGPAGVYRTGQAAKSFFIDVIFKEGGDMLLESLSWITEFLSGSNTNTDQFFNTLTHIAVWNSLQHTGRLALTQILEDISYKNIRRTKGEWSFNSIRDILIDTQGTEDFLMDIFSNYAVIPSQVNPFPAWYDQAPLQDKWFSVRFEFDNSIDAQVILHDVAAQVLKQDR